MIIMKQVQDQILLNVIRMMPYMPVYDPTTSDGFRGVNSVLDGGDPTNPIEDAVVKNPGNRGTLKVFRNRLCRSKFHQMVKIPLNLWYGLFQWAGLSLFTYF